MSTPKTEQGAEAKTALAVIELAKQFIPVVVAAQGPIVIKSEATIQADVKAYFDQSCNMAFSLAGMFRRKSKEVLTSAQIMDEKAAAATHAS
jgi:glycerate kinase